MATTEAAIKNLEKVCPSHILWVKAPLKYTTQEERKLCTTPSI